MQRDCAIGDHLDSGADVLHVGGGGSHESVAYVQGKAGAGGKDLESVKKPTSGTASFPKGP